MRDAIAIPVLIIALLSAAWWISRRMHPPADGLARVQASGVLRIGYANEAPFAWREGDGGAVTGEAPAVAQVIAKRLGIRTVEGVLTEFGGLIPGLRAGRFDVIAAGMYITPERAEQVLFTRPTCRIGNGLVVRVGNPSALHSFADVRGRDGIRLGVVNGAIEQRLSADLGIPVDRTIMFTDAAAAVEGLIADRIDAFACTALTARDLAKRSNGRCEAALPFTDPQIAGRSTAGYGAFAFRREDAPLQEAFERQLAAFVGSDEHRALVAPFGFDPALIPVGIDAEAVISGRAP